MPCGLFSLCVWCYVWAEVASLCVDVRGWALTARGAGRSGARSPFVSPCLSLLMMVLRVTGRRNMKGYVCVRMSERTLLVRDSRESFVAGGEQRSECKLNLRETRPSTKTRDYQQGRRRRWRLFRCMIAVAPPPSATTADGDHDDHPGHAQYFCARAQLLRKK